MPHPPAVAGQNGARQMPAHDACEVRVVIAGTPRRARGDGNTVPECSLKSSERASMGNRGGSVAGRWRRGPRGARARLGPASVSALPALRPSHAARVHGLETLPALWPAIPERAAPAMRRLLAFLGLDAGPTEENFLHGGPVSPSTIGGGMTIKGELRGEGPLTVLGQFEGDIVLDGTLHVGPEARVDANITARVIVIAGVVRGNLSADTRVKGEIWVAQP